MKQIFIVSLFFLIFLVCCCQAKITHAIAKGVELNIPDDNEMIMKKNDLWREHPNIYVRMNLTKKGPVLPKIEGTVEIWIKCPKFRVRDKTGRFLQDILSDIVGNRGLGQQPQSLEEIMDIQSRYREKPNFEATEFFGDIVSGQGWVCEPEKAPWEIETKKIQPIAEQIFSAGVEKNLKLAQSVNRFERSCTEYCGFLEGEESGIKFKSKIRLITSSPFLFLNEVHDAEIRNYYFIREFIDFSEGKVADADIEPPK